MMTQTGAEQGWHQQICQTGQRKVNGASILHRTLGNWGNLGEGLFQGKPHQLVVQCQVNRPENIYSSDIIWTYTYCP